MKCLLVFSVLLASSLGHPASQDDKILNGVNASPGQFPFQVAMKYVTGGLHCGGGIISPTTVLSAAHCVYQQYSSDFLITAGSINLSSGGTSYAISQMFYHRNFDPDQLQNDISLIIISGSFQYGGSVQPVSLPSANLNIPDGTRVTAIGWGLTSYPSNDIPNTLQTTQLPVVSNQMCSNALSTSILSSQICAGGTFGTGMCNGDSGSPLVLDTTVVGLVSWGNPCAQGVPDVFTRVSSFLDWIGVNVHNIESSRPLVDAVKTKNIAPPNHTPYKFNRTKPFLGKLV